MDLADEFIRRLERQRNMELDEGFEFQNGEGLAPWGELHDFNKPLQNTFENPVFDLNSDKHYSSFFNPQNCFRVTTFDYENPLFGSNNNNNINNDDSYHENKVEEGKFRGRWVAPISTPTFQVKHFNKPINSLSTQEKTSSNENNIIIFEENVEEDFQDENEELNRMNGEEDEGKKDKKRSIFTSPPIKRSAAYIIAKGPPRVCDACMVGIHCGDLPYPDGSKPSNKQLNNMVGQEIAKEKLKAKNKDLSSDPPLTPDSGEENGEQTIKENGTMKQVTNDLLEGGDGENVKSLGEGNEESIENMIDRQISDKLTVAIIERVQLKLKLDELDPNSPEYNDLLEDLDEKEEQLQQLCASLDIEDDLTVTSNPLLRRKEAKKRKLSEIMRATALTTTTTTVGSVGGAIVGGVTGFLLGFGVPGAIAGAAVGAGIGGAGGASVGIYASHVQMSKRPKFCANCKVQMTKTKLGKIPYQCRSCWIWFCDRCVPNELILETQTFRTIQYEEEEAIVDEEVSDMVLLQTDPGEESNVVQPVLFSHQNLKNKKRSKIKRGKLEDITQVSRASRERKGYCSWCFKETVHLFVERGHFTRNIWNCQGCMQRTLKCRNPKCTCMARGLVGYDEEGCWKCQKKIESWESASLYVEDLVRNGYCSWCFQFSEHDPICDLSVLKVFKCRNCRNTTVPCNACPKGDGWGMARDNGFFWKGKCALHTKHIESWDEVEKNINLSELKQMWCPYCVEKTTHITMGPGGLINRKTAFLCKGCHQRTYRCSRKRCTDGMALHARKKCLRCTLSASSSSSSLSFEALLLKKERIYSEQSGRSAILRNLSRQSYNRERKKATDEGYLRPFLLLVSMEPQMRVLTAATLGIDLIRRPCFGDPHAEAWEIIGHYNKGIIFRTRKASEEITKLAVTKATWYTSLRRSMRATMKSTTFKKVSASITKEACKNPDINILPEMELEYLEKFGHWQHMMIAPDIAKIADQIMENKDFQEKMKVLEKRGLGSPVIKRLLAEMFAEAQFCSADQHDDIINHTDEILVSSTDIAPSDESVIEFKNKIKNGIGSTYERKAKVMNWTAVTIPAAYVKLTVWFVVGSALALWMGPIGWAVEWGASLALGTVITAWVCGEVYLGPSHEEMTPAIVLICMQRLTLASEGIDISEYMIDFPDLGDDFHYEPEYL